MDTSTNGGIDKFNSSVSVARLNQNKREKKMAQINNLQWRRLPVSIDRNCRSKLENSSDRQIKVKTVNSSTKFFLKKS